MDKKSIIKMSIFTAILATIFLPPFVKYQELRWKSKQLESQIKALQEETKKLKAEKIKLQSDITYIERKARERIGVVKKGEIILKETSKRQ